MRNFTDTSTGSVYNEFKFSKQQLKDLEKWIPKSVFIEQIECYQNCIDGDFLINLEQRPFYQELGRSKLKTKLTKIINYLNKAILEINNLKKDHTNYFSQLFSLAQKQNMDTQLDSLRQVRNLHQIMLDKLDADRTHKGKPHILANEIQKIWEFTTGSKIDRKRLSMAHNKNSPIDPFFEVLRYVLRCANYHLENPSNYIIER
jgi:hypothetical protein